MCRYRKKPIIIVAYRFSFREFFGKHRVPTEFRNAVDVRLDISKGKSIYFISTLEGDMEVKEGDWVIKGIKGEFYPCKNSIFRKTYEKVK